MQLREAGVRLPILVFGLLSGGREEIEAVFSQELTPTIVDLISRGGPRGGLQEVEQGATLHVKTDTGMGRLGFPPRSPLQ